MQQQAWRVAHTSGVREYVTDALNEFAEDFDVDALADEFRQAINAQLPDGARLHGDDVFGQSVDLGAAIDQVDFWEIAARHESDIYRKQR